MKAASDNKEEKDGFETVVKRTQLWVSCKPILTAKRPACFAAAIAVHRGEG